MGSASPRRSRRCWGKTVISQEDYSDQLDAAVRKLLSVLDQDKQLVELGKRFAACLGVSKSEPTELNGLSHTKIVRELRTSPGRTWTRRSRRR
ncbi:hypothetical protein ACIBIZ_08775 [Nonomuraea spiralis]|uniref:hypothetical protein n=1 Tax=Nonomuraea spiralis TaxID=46182 RepID=UPI0037B7A7DC